jgi:hypothetical protein
MNYVITGKNRLTGEREVISGKLSKESCERLLAAWKQRRRGKYKLAYTRLKMEPVLYKATLFTPPLMKINQTQFVTIETRNSYGKKSFYKNQKESQRPLSDRGTPYVYVLLAVLGKGQHQTEAA